MLTEPLLQVYQGTSLRCESVYCNVWHVAGAQYVSLPSRWWPFFFFFLFNVEQVVLENKPAPIFCPALKFQGKEFRGITKGFAISSESGLHTTGKFIEGDIHL